MGRENVENLLSGTKAGFKATRNLVFNQKAEKVKMERIIRSIVDNVLSGRKAGFKTILNLVFNQKKERKKMDHQKSKSTFSATLLALVLGTFAFWTGPTAVTGQEMVKDPTTGQMVSKPKYGGRFTFATGGYEPVHTDPVFHGGVGVATASVSEQLAMGNWGINRDEVDFSSQFIPVSAARGQLAERWELPDPLTYIFHIRQGVRWHKKPPMNGRALTARDIEYNYHRNLGLGSGFTEKAEGFAASLLTVPIESIRATDEATVVFKLKEPRLTALHSILITDNASFILPPEVIRQHGDVKDWRTLVGTGPYELTDWVEGTSMTHTRNPDYWGHDEKYPQNRLPYIDELRMLFLKDQATYLAALRSGKVDYLGFTAGVSDIVSIDQVESLRKTNPEIRLIPWWDRSETSYALDVSKPPFDDIRVRQAMQRALDLKTINDSYYKGDAKWQPQGVIGEALSGYTPFDQWPERFKQSYAYDPEGAKKLLKEAGYPNGFKTVLNHFGEFDLSYTELAAEYFRAIGVDVEIRVLDRASFIPLVMEGTMEGMAMTIQGWNIPWGAAGALRFRMHSTSDWNLHKFKDAEVDAKIEAAEAAATMEEQLRLASELDMKLIEQHWYVWGPKAGKFMAVQPWVKGYNGEVHLGPQNRLPIFARLWIDSELKEAMGH